jgi:hypothetical protein
MNPDFCDMLSAFNEAGGISRRMGFNPFLARVTRCVMLRPGESLAKPT